MEVVLGDVVGGCFWWLVGKFGWLVVVVDDWFVVCGDVGVLFG